MARPREQLLSHETIVDAALATLRRGGPWSLREIARHLGVHPSSIYHYVHGIDDLIEAVRSKIVSSIEYKQFDELPWDEAVLLWAHSFRRAFASAPEFVALAARSPVRGLETFQMYETLSRAAVREGWKHDEILRLITVFETYIFGSVLDGAGPSVVFDPSAVREHAPETSRAFDEVMIQGSDPISGPAFDLGIHALIEGLRPSNLQPPRDGAMSSRSQD